MRIRSSPKLVTFQSTLSVRRATAGGQQESVLFGISIHALREESDLIWRVSGGPFAISIHALREESDPLRRQLVVQQPISIHALREESDLDNDNRRLNSIISIHALREESDCAAGHFCPLFETQASCLALRISNNTAGTTNNIPKTSN